LTGVEEQHQYKTGASGWEKLDVDVDSQRQQIKDGDRKACPFRTSGDPITPQLLFERLATLAADGALLTCGIAGEDETERPDGLVEKHAYTLLRVVECRGFRLLELRNPWGTKKGRWNGDWSDWSPLWDEHPEVRRQLRPRRKHDGRCWMSFTDFEANWDYVNVGKPSLD
jgi:hypothetical protein